MASSEACIAHDEGMFVSACLQGCLECIPGWAVLALAN
jgi:hypothetical protein